MDYKMNDYHVWMESELDGKPVFVISGTYDECLKLKMLLLEIDFSKDFWIEDDIGRLVK